MAHLLLYDLFWLRQCVKLLSPNLCFSSNNLKGALTANPPRPSDIRWRCHCHFGASCSDNAIKIKRAAGIVRLSATSAYKSWGTTPQVLHACSTILLLSLLLFITNMLRVILIWVQHIAFLLSAHGLSVKSTVCGSNIVPGERQKNR